MFPETFTFINESFEADTVSPQQLDILLAGGWRHFGTNFFRYNLAPSQLELRFVIPLRIRLSEFNYSKNHKRIFRKNNDLEVSLAPINIDQEKIDLFDRHKNRFKEFTPESIYNFFDEDAASTPCDSFEFCVRDHSGRLLAASFFDVGDESISTTYAMFEPSEAKRSLGIYTMLLEIEHGIETEKVHYYHGYAYKGESFYDYKKKFPALEAYDWNGNWGAFDGE